MKFLAKNKLMSTGLAATLATFFVLSSFVDADAHWRRWRHNHRGGVAAGIIAGAIIGGAIVAGSRATRHRHRHCHRNRRGRIIRCHRHRHHRRHHR